MSIATWRAPDSEPRSRRAHRRCRNPHRARPWARASPRRVARPAAADLLLQDRGVVVGRRRARKMPAHHARIRHARSIARRSQRPSRKRSSTHRSVGVRKKRQMRGALDQLESAVRQMLASQRPAAANASVSRFPATTSAGCVMSAASSRISVVTITASAPRAPGDGSPCAKICWRTPQASPGRARAVHLQREKALDRQHPRDGSSSPKRASVSRDTACGQYRRRRSAATCRRGRCARPAAGRGAPSAARPTRRATSRGRQRARFGRRSARRPRRRRLEGERRGGALRPWPGRSTAWTRKRAASRATSGPQRPECIAKPCNSTSGGPLPIDSTCSAAHRRRSAHVATGVCGNPGGALGECIDVGDRVRRASVTRRRAVPFGTVGGRIAGTQNPRSRSASASSTAAALSPTMSGWIAVSSRAASSAARACLPKTRDEPARCACRGASSRMILRLARSASARAAGPRSCTRTAARSRPGRR